MRIAISRAVVDHILAEAAASPDREICGLLFGDGTAIEALAPAANVAADSACAFEVDPAALFAAIRAERAGGPRLIGHYHSHPNGHAGPSAADAAAAAPGSLWLIAGGGRLTAWAMEGGGFIPVILDIGP